MKNRLSDLNDHLFAQMERLSDEDLEGDKLRTEIERSRAVSACARDIIANGALTLQAQKVIWERNIDTGNVPRMLQNDQVKGKS